MAVRNQTVWLITAAQLCTIPEVNIVVGANDVVTLLAKEVDETTKRKSKFTLSVVTNVTKAYATVRNRRVEDFTLGDLRQWLIAKGEANVPNIANMEVDLRDGGLIVAKLGELNPNPPVVTP